MTAFYNEIDPYAAAWLRNLIAAGHIAPGVVDERSIVDLSPGDVAGFTQVHFFAGIGGWSLAARLAGWPDDRPLWTGSCPCQPFSVAGKGAGQDDKRHLWPEFHRLIAACRPDVVMGEQVAAAVGKSWLDGVHSDLESIGYTCGAAVVPACAVDAPHRRDRLWFVADRGDMADADQSRTSQERQQRGGQLGRIGGNSIDRDVSMADGAGLDDGRSAPESLERRELEPGIGSVPGTLVDDQSERRGEGWSQHDVRSGRNAATGQNRGDDSGTMGDADGPERAPWLAQSVGNESGPERVAQSGARGFWHDSTLAVGADGKARRVKPGVRLLAHGVPARVGKLRAFGNAIVPQVAAEIIGAYFDCRPTLLIASA